MKSNHRTTCSMDCPDTCSLDVEVEMGRVTAIRGDHRNPLTQDFICNKIRRFSNRLYGEDRLRHPLRRKGNKGSGSFMRISWEEAIEEISINMQQVRDRWGGEAILPYYYGGSNGMLTQGLVDLHYFRRLGASRLATTVCAASTTVAARALYGLIPGTAFEDYAHARFILIWGANPTHSNIHLVPYLKQARRRGAQIAVVDPRRILGNDTVDFSLQPLPGSDVAVALGMINHLSEKGLIDSEFLETHTTGWRELLARAGDFPLEKAARLSGVAARDMAHLAESYARSSPAVIRCGWGVERNRNGVSSVAAILALPAVAGKFGRVGGGFTLSNSGACPIDEEKLGLASESPTRLLNMNHLGRILLTEAIPPVKVLFVYNCNPAVTVPNGNLVIAGLEREDLFTVVFDQVQTDTALFADIVLPATTFLEHSELKRSYGSYSLQIGEPVVAPEGESKPNSEVFQLLGRSMGWKDEIFREDQDALLRRAVDSVKVPSAEKPDLETLRARGAMPFDFSGTNPIQFVNVHPRTSDGKIHLFPHELGPEPYLYREIASTSEYPLVLISPAGNRTISSTLGEFNLPKAYVSMHPRDAAARGISDDCHVRVFNDRGEVHCTLRLDTRLRQGVASLPKGIWRRATGNGSAGTVLIPDDVTPISNGACFNDARVQVESLENRSHFLY